ncbi:MAG: exo-alpha-sialidase, partial [Verrucomicrobia bacterium]|nr:exo-alpha-sialidase [Verrucomicrobiota bacterium]
VVGGGLVEGRGLGGAWGATRMAALFLGDGTLVCAAETRSAGRRVRVEWADKSLKFWERTGPLNRAFVMPCLSPVVLQPAIDAFAMLAVAPEPYNRLVLIRAKKGFRKWDRPRRLALAVEGTPIAAVRLRDRRFLLAYNPEGKRNVIRLAVSEDLEHWTPAGEAASAPQGELLEPALAQDSDEKVHLLFNWNGKKIRHVVLDPEKIQPAASRGRGNASARR